jgi:nitrogen fixation/metabolism regulation signal transduction histidine kinase
MKLSVQHLQRSLESAEVDDETFKSVFARITRTLVEQIDALARIASEFSSFARMPQQVLEPLDINTVLREAATLMQAEGGTAITAEYADEPLVVSADREELRRAFINLLKNASQAVPSDRSARIRVRTSRIEDEGIEMVLCEIEDNGSGVPDELRDHIFEPNFSTKTSGTGLGLAIVLKAVEDIHGTIDFETRPGIGTTFRIKLPAV